MCNMSSCLFLLDEEISSQHRCFHCDTAAVNFWIEVATSLARINIRKEATLPFVISPLVMVINLYRRPRHVKIN